MIAVMIRLSTNPVNAVTASGTASTRAWVVVGDFPNSAGALLVGSSPHDARSRLNSSTIFKAF